MLSLHRRTRLEPSASFWASSAGVCPNVSTQGWEFSMQTQTQQRFGETRGRPTDTQPLRLNGNGDVLTEPRQMSSAGDGHPPSFRDVSSGPRVHLCQQRAVLAMERRVPLLRYAPPGLFPRCPRTTHTVCLNRQGEKKIIY